MCSRLWADTIPGTGHATEAPATAGTGPTTKGVAMRVRSLLRVGGAVGAAALTIGAVAPAGYAEPTEVSFFDAIWGVGYDNIVTGVDPDDPLVLFAGVTADEWCEDDKGTTATVRARTKGDTRVETLVDRGPLYVYDAGGLPFFEFADQYCNGEVTDPEPVAVGTGTIRFRVEFTNGAPPFVTTTVNGSVRTADGDTWAVNGYQELTFDPGPNPKTISFTIRNQR